jgi:diaminohydroxyphosphoribosylaminopyrimidine deaminase/5-amino-6-(5-phosphoribosylamino)uracil reductase
MSPEPIFSDFDGRAMARALELAERGAQTTHPNPRVGCVIARGEQIIAEGWHERAGGPHAEAAALQALRALLAANSRAASAAPQSGSASSGGAASATSAVAFASAGAQALNLADCTAYVNLEPCSHHGRTPPCADALIAARIGRVVYAIDDPNPQVAGQGAAKLRAAGVKVEAGLMAAEAEEMNAGFLVWKRTGRPFVRIKMGTSLDGRIALANGQSRWITSEAARADVQRWRARSSAVLTGIGTVLADDPRLNVRLPGAQRQPLRVILDSELRTPATAQILDASAPTMIFTGAAAAEAALVAKGARIERAGEPPRAEASAALRAALGRHSAQGPTAPGQHSAERLTAPGRHSAERRTSESSASSGMNLHAVLRRLGELDINEVLVEAGPTLSGAFVQAGLADELLLYMAPKLLGPQARPLFNLPLLEDLQHARRFRIIEQLLIGDDLRIRLRSA